MKIYTDMKQWRQDRHSLTGSLGFVATMGHLHGGHGSLLTQSKYENDTTVLSIFVNPTQFNNNSDYNNYPRTLEEDLAYAEKTNVDYVVLPTYNDLFPDDFRFQLQENCLSTIMEGEYRPGHFTGVLTVIMKFLLLIKPSQAYFGMKDYQQYQLIRDMAASFFLDCRIVPCVTVRDSGGLALSSRNSRLSEAQLNMARQFAKSLNLKRPTESIISELENLDMKVDYIKEYEGRRYGAVFVGDVRLIDNVEITQD